MQSLASMMCAACLSNGEASVGLSVCLDFFHVSPPQHQAEAVSDQDLAGSMIMGGDQHWELLPLQVGR